MLQIISHRAMGAAISLRAKFVSMTCALAGCCLALAAGAQTVITVAGGSIGDGGPATSALVPSPFAAVADAAGNIYIATGNQGRIRKVNSQGIISTYAGVGGGNYAGENGPATSASFVITSGVALDSAGNLYVSDQGACVVVRISAATGIVTRVAGTPFACNFSGDNGPATSAQIGSANDVAIDASNNIYIADGTRRVRKISASTGIITTIAGTGAGGSSGDGGPATAATLSNPRRLALDGAGNLYIADVSANRVRKVSAGGVISTIAGTGISGYSGDGGPAVSAALNSPSGVALDSAGNILISELSNHRVRKISAADGTISTIAGVGSPGFAGDGSAATTAALNGPQCVSLDSAGNIYVCDRLNSRVRKIAPGGTITTIAGGGSLGNGGAATLAFITQPQGIAMDAAGNIYFADTLNAMIRKISTGGVMSVVAGTGSAGYGGDGGPATSAMLNNPYGLAIDAVGNLFVGDTGNFRVRRIDAASGIITTLAGNGVSGAGPNGSQAVGTQIRSPYGVAVDTGGNVYFAEVGSGAWRIRRINSGNGAMFTVAGNGSVGVTCANGNATSLSLSSFAPGVALDNANNLYITDTSNNCIRKVNLSNGQMTTVAGNGNFAYTGDGGPATAASLNSPEGFTIAPDGTWYIGDSGNNVIRKVTPAGIISTVAGTGAAGAVNGPPASATFSYPQQIVVDRDGALVVSDTSSGRIRRIYLVAEGLQASECCLLDFSKSVVGPSSRQYVTLTNTGPTVSSLSNVAVSSGLFTIVSNTCGATIAVNASCVIAIELTAPFSGSVSAQLTATVDGQQASITLAAASPTLPLPKPDIKVTRNSNLNGVAVQSDGKIIVDGNFTSVDGVARQGPVRLNANGSFDRSLLLTVDGPIYGLRSFGNLVYVFGGFTRLNGLDRAGLAQIDLTASGTTATSWNPNPQPANSIADIALDSAGNLLVYGGNMTIGGISGVQVARISPITGLADPVFRGFPNIFAKDIRVAASGAIYVTGNIAPSQPTQNFRIYKLNPVTGAIDSSWNASPQSIDMSKPNVAVAANGDVYVGGQIAGNAVVGQTFTAPRPFTKLSSIDGSVPPQWNPPFINVINDISPDNAGSVYAMRAVFYNDSASLFATKFDAITGAIDPAFAPLEATGGNGDQGLLVMPDGLLVGGDISYIGNTRVGPLAKLNLATGALLGSFATNMTMPGYLSAVNALSTGKIMIGGNFTAIDGVPITNLARLNADGTFDPSFNSGLNGFVTNIHELGSSLFVGGFLPTANPLQIQFLTRFNAATGARDPAWSVQTDGRVRGAVLDAATNSLYIIGGFYKVNNVVRPCVAKIDATTGVLDPLWAPPLNSLGNGLNCGRAIALNGNKVYIGFFNSPGSGGSPRILVNGQPRFLARVDKATGAVDNSWDPNPNGPVNALRDTGSQIYVSGGFNSIGGVSTRIARINATTGAVDPTFANSLQGLPASPQNIHVQAGSVFLAGTTAGSNSEMSRNFIWKLQADASRDFTWTPVFDEVSFDNIFGASVSTYSTDKLLVAGGFQRVSGLPRSALAAFSALNQVSLTLNMRGRGTVVLQTPQSSTSCIDCASGSYPYAFDSGTTVTLTAVPSATSVFAGWVGATGSATCTGTGACVVPLSSASTVNAVFRQNRNFSQQ